MKIVTLGEIMLRLSTPGNTRFVQSDSFDVVYGGGEANVAVSCANYGHEAYFVSKLPTHEIGQSAVNALRKYGVRTDFIARGGDRVGIYYLETGASMRPSKVIYDRAHSSIAEADAADFDFDAIMEGADWFHWSGITPAISDKAAELTRLACIAAKKHGVTVSVDLNFRKKLWTKEKAQSIMKPLMEYVDVCIGNEEDAELCLGFKPDADVEGGETNAEGYKGIFPPDGRDVRVQVCDLDTARVVLGDAQRLEGHDLQRQGVLRVEALRHRPDHRPRGRRRLVLGRRDPRPADQAHAGRGTRIRRGGIGPEAHDQRRLQPRIGRGGGIVGRR